MRPEDQRGGKGPGEAEAQGSAGGGAAGGPGLGRAEAVRPARGLGPVLGAVSGWQSRAGQGAAQPQKRKGTVILHLPAGGEGLKPNFVMGKVL